MWDITDLEEVEEELPEVEVTYEDSLWQEEMSGDQFGSECLLLGLVDGKKHLVPN